MTIPDSLRNHATASPFRFSSDNNFRKRCNLFDRPCEQKQRGKIFVCNFAADQCGQGGVMAKVTEIEIGGTKLVIEEHENVTDPATGRAYTGSWIWNTSFLLAHWMASVGSIFKGKRVVELGAGTGIPGLVAAVLGADVVLTDVRALLPGLQRNVDGNCLGDRVRVQELQWGNDCSALSDPPVDFILMSDLLYDVTAMPELCSAMRQLSNESTQIVVACELRFGTSECLEMMMEEGFGICHVPQYQLPVDWQGGDYAIFMVAKQKTNEDP